MKNKLKAKIFSVLTIFALGCGWMTLNSVYINNVYAEDSTRASLFVSPMNQKIVLIPGETYSSSISISNSASSTEDLKYTAEIGSYNQKKSETSKDDYGVTDVSSVTEYNAMMDWISLEKTEGVAAPNGTDILNFTIKVPKNAPAGAQYASILVYESEEEDSDSSSDNSANISARYQLASSIMANVAGETIEKGAITENTIPSILTSNKLSATSMVRNEGNVYTDATYTLQVWPLMSDEEICTNEENSVTRTVLPNTERYHTESCELPSVGIFRAKQVVTIFGEESVLEKTIIVCPVWLMIVILVIIIAIVAGVIIIIRKHTKKSE